MSWILLPLALMLCLSGCGESQDPLLLLVAEYYQHIDTANYGAAYALLTETTKERLAMADYVAKHTTIYGSIGVTSVEATFAQPVSHEQGYAVEAEISLRTDSIGLIAWQEELVLRHEGEAWKLDWNPGLLLGSLDWGDTVRLVTDVAGRGEILSKDATAWAVNGYAPTAYVRLPITGEKEETFAARVAPLLDMTEDEVLRILRSDRSAADGLALLKAYSVGAMTDALDARLKDAGMGVDYEKYSPIRYYPQGNMLSHTLGYVQGIDEEKLKEWADKGYTENSRVGKDGLELQYEEQLRGKDGKYLRIYDESGSIKKTVGGYAALDGFDLELTINYPLQAHATALLHDLPADYRGVAIVMDYKTGEVLASASYPDYDPNDFTIRMPAALWEAMLDPTNHSPMVNRITQGRYPPGSIVKPFTAAAGLDTGKFSTDFVFPGKIDEDREWTPSGSWHYPAIRRVSGSYGTMNMTNAMVQSDNIYFAYIALEIGWEILEPHLKSAGFAEAVPYDIATRKSQIYSREDLSNRKLLADTGYGQGEMLSTPIQLAASFAALAGGGTAMKPRLVSALKRLDGEEYTTVQEYEAEIWKAHVIGSDSTLNSIRRMLKEVMVSGTGRRVGVDGVTLFGKTGTAQLDDNQSREIAWNVVFGENDEGYSRMVLVMLEIPAGQGSERYTIAEKLLLPESAEYSSLHKAE